MLDELYKHGLFLHADVYFALCVHYIRSRYRSTLVRSLLEQGLVQPPNPLFTEHFRTALGRNPCCR